MSARRKKRTVIGWREWVELPDWGLRVKAKIDTGARSSSIDVTRIEHLPGGRVRFEVRPRRKGGKTRSVEADILKSTRVKSSNGQVQERIVVRTILRLAGVEKPIHVTLTCRRKMLHRMLLGREALGADFLIDAGADHLLPDG